MVETFQTFGRHKGSFGLNVGPDNKGKVSYVDHGNGISFSSAVIASVAVQGNTATIRGLRVHRHGPDNFTIIVQDNADPGAGQDTFPITLDTGYSRSGVLQGGNIQIQ